MPEPTMLEEMIKLYHIRPARITPKLILFECNVKRTWLYSVVNRHVSNPGVNDVERVYKYLKTVC